MYRKKGQNNYSELCGPATNIITSWTLAQFPKAQRNANHSDKKERKKKITENTTFDGTYE